MQNQVCTYVRVGVGMQNEKVYACRTEVVCGCRMKMGQGQLVLHFLIGGLRVRGLRFTWTSRAYISAKQANIGLTLRYPGVQVYKPRFADFYKCVGE